MKKSTGSIIIWIGAASILFALYGVVNGEGFLDALLGIVIGVSLIGTVLIERNKKKSDSNK